MYDVSTAPALTQALAEIAGNSSGVPYVINFQNNITGTNQFFINADVIINGGGYSLDMAGGLGSSGSDRAFFVAGGNVTFQNLTISNGKAQGGTGGLGNGGGGGGAGLGGGIFVGSGTYATGTGSTVRAISVPQVTISNVIFSGNQANGGAGGQYSGSTQSGGGGGGMGGAGGAGLISTDFMWSGGGGGFGVTAFGGSAQQSGSGAVVINGGTGAFILAPFPTTSWHGGGSGYGLSGTTQGGNYGGGGGGGENSTSNFGASPGGGGGVGGGDSYGNVGGQGGFGGGGGAGQSAVGAGGFGGGGAGSVNYSGGTGGFGGGGGGASGSSTPGGFGAGSGDANGNGGGGLGAGGALFVMPGASVTIQNSSISGGSVSGGASGGGSAGAGFGMASGIFMYGANLTYDVTSGVSTVSDSIVDGYFFDLSFTGVTKTGSGTLVLSNPANAWHGMTSVQAGTLEVYTVSLPSTIFNLINVSANANLTFGSVANTSGTAAMFITGAGGVTIGDADNLGAGGVITLSGGNTYSGGTVVNGSTLRAGGAQAFGIAGGMSLWSSTASGTAGTVNGATVDVNGFSTTVAGLFGDGRATVTNSSTTAATLTVTGSSSQYQGQISGPIALTAASTGTFTLGGSTTYSGATNVDAGTLLVSGTLGAGATLAEGVTVANGAALGGTGTINRAVAVESGGTLAAGSGTLTVGSLALEDGANLSFFLGGAGSPPVFAQDAAGLDLGKNVTVTLATGTGFGAGVYWLIDSFYTFDQSNGFSGWSIVGVPSAYSATFHLGQATDAHPGLSLVVTVPEPSTLVLALAALACTAWEVTRRCRRSTPDPKSFLCVGLGRQADPFA